MKILLWLLVLVSPFISLAQSKQCNCSKDKYMRGSINCKTVVLKNDSKLYYQFNCDSLWLTLEHKSGIRKVIYSMSGNMFKELYGYNYRLGYQLAKEYKRYLLFRSGCPANGPCNFILVNNVNGKKVKEFGELIYDHSNNLFYDFILYLKNKNNKLYLVLDYIDTGRKHTFLLNKNDFTGIIPEYQINDVMVHNNVLLITYPHLSGGKRVIKRFVVNLLKHHS
jgi:hypothetical protein